MEISVNHIIGFLEKEGWQLANSNAKFLFYAPPKDLGFADNFTLPILSTATVEFPDHDRVLKETLKTISAIYSKDIHSLIFDIEEYLGILRQNALYFKLESTEVIFENTLDIQEIWTFLKNLSVSYQNFLKSKFNRDFLNTAKTPASVRNYEQSLIYLKKYSKLRLIELSYQSFSFGVASDTVMGKDKITNPEVNKWRREVSPAYEKEVIELDLTLKENVDLILEKYDDSERKGIFEPILKSIKNDRINVFKTDYAFSKKTKIIRPPKSTIDRIIQRTSPLEEPKKELAMYQIIVPVDKAKSKISIQTSSIDSSLFSKQLDRMPWKVEKIDFGDLTLTFREPLEVIISLDPDTSEFEVSFDTLNIDFSVEDFNSIGQELFERIIEKYLSFTAIRGVESTTGLSNEQIQLLEFFSTNLEEEPLKG